MSDRVVGGESLADEVARVLGEHGMVLRETLGTTARPLMVVCDCGLRTPCETVPAAYFAHRAHVATALLPLFERVQAVARRDALTEAADAAVFERFSLWTLTRDAVADWLRDRAGEGS